MKIIIDGVPHDVIDALQGAALGDLRRLKKEADITVRSIQATFNRLGEESAARAESGEEYDTLILLEDDDFLQSMIGLIYLARRSAGETLTLADAENTRFDNFSLDFDDEDEEPEAPKGEAVESTDPNV